MPDMTLQQIKEQITARFNRGYRLVFWYDGKGEFAEDVKSLTLPGASVYVLTPGQSFHDKRILTRDRANEKFLVYAPFPKPDVYENHLEDVYLYSSHFSASRIALVAENGRIPEAVASVLSGYASFFQSKERMDRFLTISEDGMPWTVKKAKLSMMAAVARVRSPMSELILQAVVKKELPCLLMGADVQNSLLVEFGKYGLLSDFWSLCGEELGINGEGMRASRLILSLFASASVGILSGSNVPKAWESLVSGKQQNAIVFLDHLKADRDTFTDISQYAGGVLDVEKALAKMELSALLSLDLFEWTDRLFIQWVCQRLSAEDLSAQISGLSISEICEKREGMYFSSDYQTAYKMLQAAAKVLTAAAYEPASGSMANVVQQYKTSDFLIDRAYRMYCYYGDRLTERARTALRQDLEALGELVEHVYTHLYLDPVIRNWNGHLDDPGTSQLTSQRRFFSHYVAGRNERTVVIVSDAFRYEVGRETEDRLSMNRLYKVHVEEMLGLVPSYTRLGMAALLPHRELSIADDGSGVVDGEICNSLAKREWKLKQSVSEAKAVQADDLRQMKRADVRAFCKGTQVLYVYHDQIDTRGENSPDEVCQAAEEAVEEIVRIVKQLNVDGYFQRFLITADHGFIYRRKAAEEDEKIGNVSGAGSIVKRRYIIGKHPVVGQGITHLPLTVTLGSKDDRYVSFPVSSCVFKAPGSGGRNYVHGGSSPQECLLPVVIVQAARGRQEERKAMLQLMTAQSVVHTLSPTWEFIQREPVGSGIFPAEYKVRMVDNKGMVISDEPTIYANSASENLNDRLFRVVLHLKAQDYDGGKEYTLQILSVETGLEVSRSIVQLDIPI